MVDASAGGSLSAARRRLDRVEYNFRPAANPTAGPVCCEEGYIEQLGGAEDVRTSMRKKCLQ